ncbi:hypothetical protein NEOC65_001273 [Neochlamydia sp. AcF65]|nr:hypothetical protein [Neochlamydia sp. AcF65]
MNRAYSAIDCKEFQSRFEENKLRRWLAMSKQIKTFI